MSETHRERDRERKSKYTLRFRLLCNSLRCSFFSFGFGEKNSQNFHIVQFIRQYCVLRCCWYPITRTHLQTLWKSRKKTILMCVTQVTQCCWADIERRTPNKCASIPTDIKWGLSSDMPMVFSLSFFLLLFYSNELISHLWDGWRQVFNCFWRCVWECDAIYTIPLEFSELRVCFFRLKFQIFRAV